MSSAAVNRIEVNVTAVNRIEATLRISGQVATIVTQPAVDAALGIDRVNGNTSKYLNERGQFTAQAPATVNWGAIGGTLSSQTDLQTALNGKQAAGDYATNTALTNGLAGKQNTLGFTPENISNKSINVVADSTSNTKYPSVKAIFDYITQQGFLVAGDLNGYATQSWVNLQGFITNVVTALGYTPENVANKKTTLADNSDTFYPSQKAVKTAVDAKQDALGFTPENAANKSTTTADSGSSVKFPVWSAVVSYVTGLGYITNVITALGYTPANKAGDTFTGSISASNLSGTNTGDETASGIRNKVGNASASNTGVLSSTDWSTFNGKQDALGFTAVPNTRTISTSSPLSGGGDLSANRTIAIADAAADGATKGAAAFTAADFNSAAGVISIDYTNGQSASAANKGFLTAADWSTFNAKQNALNGTGFVRQDGAATTYDTLSRTRTFAQTCAEVSLTGTTAETIVDTITIAANTLAANDIVQVYARFLKTATAAATVRIYTNTATSLSGAVLLGSFTMSAANRFLGFERHIICKASGLIEVASATNTTNASDENAIGAAETTTTITYSNTNYLIISMQLNNSTDTIRRSFSQVQHQRQAS